MRCFLELREGVAERARTMFDIYEREQVCDNLAATQECYNTPDLCNQGSRVIRWLVLGGVYYEGVVWLGISQSVCGIREIM